MSLGLMNLYFFIFIRRLELVRILWIFLGSIWIEFIVIIYNLRGIWIGNWIWYKCVMRRRRVEFGIIVFWYGVVLGVVVCVFFVLYDMF